MNDSLISNEKQQYLIREENIKQFVSILKKKKYYMLNKNFQYEWLFGLYHISKIPNLITTDSLLYLLIIYSHIKDDYYMVFTTYYLKTDDTIIREKVTDRFTIKRLTGKMENSKLGMNFEITKSKLKNIIFTLNNGDEKLDFMVKVNKLTPQGNKGFVRSGYNTYDCAMSFSYLNCELFFKKYIKIGNGYTEFVHGTLKDDIIYHNHLVVKNNGWLALNFSFKDSQKNKYEIRASTSFWNVAQKDPYHRIHILKNNVRYWYQSVTDQGLITIKDVKYWIAPDTNIRYIIDFKFYIKEIGWIHVKSISKKDNDMDWRFITIGKQDTLLSLYNAPIKIKIYSSGKNRQISEGFGVLEYVVNYSTKSSSPNIKQ